VGVLAAFVIVPGAACRLGDAGAPAGRSEQPAGVLPALIGMEHHPGDRPAPDRDRHAQRRLSQFVGGRQTHPARRRQEPQDGLAACRS
jgi:hypothetical protein